MNNIISLSSHISKQSEVECEIFIASKYKPYVTVIFNKDYNKYIIWIESPTYEKIDSLHKQGLLLLNQQMKG